MDALRHHLKRHRWLSAWLIGAALAIRMLVPAGFMPVFSAGAISIELCSGFGPEPMSMAMAMADMPHMRHHGGDKHDRGGKEPPCGFGGLSLPSLSAADPALLAVALRHILARGTLTAACDAIAAIPHLRPPLRGPPIAG